MGGRPGTTTSCASSTTAASPCLAPLGCSPARTSPGSDRLRHSMRARVVLSSRDAWMERRRTKAEYIHSHLEIDTRRHFENMWREWPLVQGLGERIGGTLPRVPALRMSTYIRIRIGS